MKTIFQHIPPEMPDRFRCPICGEKLCFEAIEACDQEDDGSWTASQIAFGCVTEPDIDTKEWSPWHRHHYRMPYVDWLPLEVAILAWLKQNFRFFSDHDMAIAAKYDAAIKEKKRKAGG